MAKVFFVLGGVAAGVVLTLAVARLIPDECAESHF